MGRVKSSEPRDVAWMTTSSRDVVTVAAMTAAATSMSSELRAIDRPMETATPAVPPTPAATDAAAATTRMSETSSPFTVREAAAMVTGWAASPPSITARVAAVIRFSV